MFPHESPSEVNRRNLEAKYRAESAAVKELRAKLAANPEFVAEELIRNLSWARDQAQAMKESLRRAQLENCERSGATYNHEREENRERWLLKYMAIEVQALAGLASVGPEVLERLAKK